MSIDLLQRRRAMMPIIGGATSAIKSGTLTLESTATSITLEHNLNSSHYITAIRMKNPTFAVNGCIGSFVHKGIGFNYTTNHYSASSAPFEVRSTYADYSDLQLGNSTIQNNTSSNAGVNSCAFYVRDNSYPFLAGTYEWVAIDLDKTPDYTESMVLATDTNPITVTHNLDEEDVMIYVEANTPTYNVTGEIATIYFGKFFESMNFKTNHYTYLYLCYETNSTAAYADIAALLSSNTDNQSTTRTANSVQMKGRGYNFYFRAGTYSVKAYKLPTFNNS